MTLVLTFPNDPPNRFPVAHYRQVLNVQGVPVFAAATNLAAAFLDELWGDPEPEWELSA